jgi:hypothetical protein
MATINLENLHKPATPDSTVPEKTRVLAQQLEKLHADVLCFQAVHGQKWARQGRQLPAFRALLDNTPYSDYALKSTFSTGGAPYALKNNVIVSRLPIRSVLQVQHEIFPKWEYSSPSAQQSGKRASRTVSWDRPILYAQLGLDDDTILHLINLHLGSRKASRIPGQIRGRSRWRSLGGWAEGRFASQLKRLGQAVETRMLVDQIFIAHGEEAWIALCGHMGTEAGEGALRLVRGSTEETRDPALIAQTLVRCDGKERGAEQFATGVSNTGEMTNQILVSKALAAYLHHTEIGSEALRGASPARQRAENIRDSGHTPVVAEFRTN